MTADEARGRIGDIRTDLRLALRALSGPKPDWDEALYRLAEVELSISIINEGARLRGDIVATDDERRRVAASLRKIRSGWASGTCYYAIINVLGYPDTSREDGGHALYSLLADLIDPDCDPTERGIDSIYDWCFAAIEGADGPDDELYCSIMRAIEDFRHPELATAHTVRAVDREALLALANELTESYVDGGADGDELVMSRGAVALVVRRIREALGCEKTERELQG